jgi:ribosomal-protein-alanine N-acetyltransferase
VPEGPGLTELVAVDRSLLDEYAAMVFRNLPRLARWEEWARRPVTVDDLAGYIDWVAAERDAGRRLPFVIARDGELVGSLGIRLDPPGAELGYWVDGAVEGAGVAFEALGLALALLRDRGLRDVEAHTDPLNARSIRLLERAGFARREPVGGPLDVYGRRL